MRIGFGGMTGLRLGLGVPRGGILVHMIRSEWEVARLFLFHFGFRAVRAFHVTLHLWYMAGKSSVDFTFTTAFCVMLSLFCSSFINGALKILHA